MKRYCIFLLMVTGCATHKIVPLTGHIGPYSLHSAESHTWAGPNISQIWSYDGTNAPQCVYSASSEPLTFPIIKALGNAVALTGGGLALGTTLRPAQTKTDNSSHNEQFQQQGP